MYKVRILAALVIYFSCAPVKGESGHEEIIGPPVYSEAVYFNTAKIDLWQNTNKENLSIGLQDGMMFMVWNGHERGAQVFSSEKIKFKRGYENKGRIVFELALQDVEFDSRIIPFIKLYDSNETEVGNIEFKTSPLDHTFPTRPGSFRSIGASWNPPQNVKYVAAGIRFLGNRIKVKVKSIRIEPNFEKPPWNPGGTRRGMPAVRYYFDSAKPDEDTAVLKSPQEISEVLQGRAKAFAKLVKYDYGVEMFVNGEPIKPIIHMAPLAGHESGYYRNMSNIGVRLHTITVKAGPYGDSPGAPCNIWLGENKYNFEPLREAIRYAVARCPDAYILLHIAINVYNDWAAENPDDVHVNTKGEKGIAGWSRVSRYGGEVPKGGEFWEASQHSEKFGNDGAKMLKALGAWLEDVPEGKVVIGAYLNGGADFQWIFSNELEYADYSKSTLTGFRKYLKEKYETDANLCQAWDMQTDFASAPIPDITKRSTGQNKGQLLSYNGKSAQCSDFNAYLSISNTRRQIAFCRGLKEGTNGRLLCGQYWPTLPAAYPLAHGDFYEMLNSPYVDFVSRGGMLGAILHGKLAVAELDLRDPKSGLDAWIDYDDAYIAKSPAEFKRQVLASFLRELAGGAGFHMWDMWGGWFWHPDTMAIFKEGIAISEYRGKGPSLGQDYVGVFVDEDAANHLVQLGRYFNTGAVEKPNFAMGLGLGGVYPLGCTGLPVRFFCMQDALNPDLTVPRVAIFINPLTMTLELAEKIKTKYCNQNRVVVFMNLPGIAAPGDLSNPQKITGFDIHEDPSVTGKSLAVLAVSDPLLRDIRPGTLLGNCPPGTGVEWFASNASADMSAGAKVLATYAGTSVPGMLVSRKKDYSLVWIGSPGAISPALIRNMARQAGMTPMLDNDNEVIIGSGLLGVVGIKGGPQHLILPAGCVVNKCLTGHSFEVIGNVLKFELGWGDYYGDVAIFTIGSEKLL